MDFETPANVEFYNPLRLLEQDLLRTACLKKESVECGIEEFAT